MKRCNIRARNKIKKHQQRGEKHIEGHIYFLKKDLMHHMKLHKKEQISHHVFLLKL